MNLLAQKIFEKIKKTPDDISVYYDLFSYCVETGDHKVNSDLRFEVVTRMKQKYGQEVIAWEELYEKTLLFDAPVDFDCYLLYIENARPLESRFYFPRRKQLLPVVKMLQRVADGETDEAFCSEPPRVGKTTLLVFFVTWLMGRDSERSNLYCAYSDTITKKFYDGVLEILTDEYTYKWKDVFPKAKVVQTNAADETINIDRKKRYPSLTCRSLYGTLNGACDCDGVLISDDLIGGIEEALNKDRLVAAWSKVDNNLLTRAKTGAKLLWWGTRWSIADPMGIRLRMLDESSMFANRRVDKIILPALDDKGESNFNYLYGVGFDTDYYLQRRASFEHNGDIASWNAQYMGEPIEREGTLFTHDTMQYYNGDLPDGEPDRIFMAVDPAFGGGDYTAAPICYQYGDMIYIHDVVYNNGDKKITQPLLAEKIKKHKVGSVRIEANKSTEDYAKGVADLLTAPRPALMTKAAGTRVSKETRIYEHAPDIRDYCIFRNDAKRGREYDLFMTNVFSFRIEGKNIHDDAPDSLAIAMDMVFKRRDIQIFKRPF